MLGWGEERLSFFEILDFFAYLVLGSSDFELEDDNDDEDAC